MLRRLDAAALRRWAVLGADALGSARDEIDGLNVFPVPDGDTGTNLLLTWSSACAAAAAAGPVDLATTAGALAEGALHGARGSSGALLGALLRGLADGLADGDGGPAALADGLARGVACAREAVGEPVEGTVLTVAAAAAAAALAAVEAAQGRPLGLADLAAAARTAADEALGTTTALLPALRDAGVVDAGGRGWAVLMAALEQAVGGLLVPAAAGPLRPTAGRPARRVGPAYEVEYLLEPAAAPQAGRDGLRRALGRLGDSVVVLAGGGPGPGGGPGRWHVHAHVDDVVAAVAAGAELGRPTRLRVTGLAARPSPGRVVVAVAEAGLAAVLADSGAHVVGDPEQLLDAVRASGAAEAVLLLAPDGVAAGRDAALRLAPDGVRAEVVEVASALQALSAGSVADPGLPLEQDAAAMAAAARGVRTASVVLARRSAQTSAGLCLPGDALGVVDGRVEVVGAGPAWVAQRLVDRLLESAPAERVTALLGPGAPDDVAPALVRHGAARGVEVLVLPGAGTGPLLLGIE